MELNDYLNEFTADWHLEGRAKATVVTYCRFVREFVAHCDGEPTLGDAKCWLALSPSAETARYRARALRAFGKWSSANDGPIWDWSNKVPLTTVKPQPQPTVTKVEYEAALGTAKCLRDRLVIELLWSTGMRVSELSRLAVEDVFVSERYVVVRQSKAGKPRLAPLSEVACRLVRRHLQGRSEGSLLKMSRTAIQLVLRRLGAPSPHAWRRGWAVNALRNGVSQTSVQVAAGWSSGAMVSRYTSSLSSDLSISEFSQKLP